MNLNTLLSLLQFGRDDEPLLSERKVSYRGEPVAAVIAETERRRAKPRRRSASTGSPCPTSSTSRPRSPPTPPSSTRPIPANTFDYHDRYDHQKLRFGDVEAAMRDAAHVVEGRYTMSPIEQAPIEPCGAIAAPETNDR